ncbi:beta-galactosidase [Cohnella soli]|uniref:beta-galactosidase n=1 Tax=Cohnella soli TaxID=425005 RepID=A0ABW0HW83_9BACL
MTQYSPDNIPFGFQYYRSPTPTREHWEQDLKRLSDLGFNTVKYWVQWRASHPAPEMYEFDDIQELMDLAAKYKLKVILNVIFDTAPAWIYKRYPESKMIAADGSVLEPTAIPCRQIGGAPGPCFHHDEANFWKDAFLRESVLRFKDHPALYLWDLWNEPELTTSIKRELSFENQVCYCDHSLNRFQLWLKAKYGRLENLNRKWQRNYRQWDEVEAPRRQAVFNDMVDWRLFFVDTVTKELKRRVEIVKDYDQVHPVMCHTVPAPIFNLITAGSDDFMLAEPCDLFGNSLGSSAWAADLLTSAAKGKRLINSEIHAMPGMTSLKPQKLEWKKLKEHILIPLARGIGGFVFWQYRPEVLGLEAPAWGHSYLDGSPTPWLEDTAKLNRIIQNDKEIILNGRRPSDGIAILYSAEGQIANFSVFGHLKTYEDTIQGAHRLLHDLNYKVEFVHEKDLATELDRFKCLWMPFPIYLNQQVCDILRQWTSNGGVLISECSFGMLQAVNGFHTYSVPGYNFDDVFGVRETWIHSEEYLDHSYHTRSITAQGDSIKMVWSENEQSGHAGRTIQGAYYQTEIETYAETEVLARFESDQSPAVTCHSYGKGKAVWIGTLAGASYFHNPTRDAQVCFAELLLDIGIIPYVRVTGDGIRADLLECRGDRREALLFVQNLYELENSATIALNQYKLSSCETWFSDGNGWVERNGIRVNLQSGDFQVFRCIVE